MAGADKGDVMPQHVGGCQNNGPFLDPYYNTAPSIQGTQKGTIILTTTHVKTRFRAGATVVLGVVGWDYIGIMENQMETSI